MQDWSSRSQFCFSRLAARSKLGAYSISRRSGGARRFRRHSAKRPGNEQGISVFIKDTSEEANGENDERLYER